VTTGLKKPIKGLKEPYEVYITSKSIRILNRKPSKYSTKPLERVFSDFWGPYSTPRLAGELYMLTFIDDYTRKSWVYFTKERRELRELFQMFRAYIEAETSLKIKQVRYNNTPEYKALEKAIATTGIQFEFTTPYTPEQNGVSERLNRSLITVARSMLQDTQLFTKFWAEAANTACYLRNRTPIGPGDITPEEAYSSKKPYIRHLRVFGYIAYTYIPKERHQKLDPNAKKIVLIGYISTARQYRLYDPVAHKVVLATAPIFDESKYIRLPEPNPTPKPEV
jgi:transposase InsO family protein